MILNVTPKQLFDSYNEMMAVNDEFYMSGDQELADRAAHLRDADWVLRRSATESIFNVKEEPNAVIVVYARMCGYSATVFSKRGEEIACKEFNYYKTEGNLMRAVSKEYDVDFDNPIASAGYMFGKSVAYDILEEREPNKADNADDRAIELVEQLGADLLDGLDDAERNPEDAVNVVAYYTAAALIGRDDPFPVDDAILDALSMTGGPARNYVREHGAAYGIEWEEF